MNGFDEEARRDEFARSNGHCHMCWMPIAFSNYGNHGARFGGIPGKLIGAAIGALGAYAVDRGPG